MAKIIIIENRTLYLVFRGLIVTLTPNIVGAITEDGKDDDTDDLIKE